MTTHSRAGFGRTAAEPGLEPYVDRQQMARLMGVNVRTIDRMVRDGMPSESWGLRARRFLPSSALAWARSRKDVEDEGRSAA
jgi:phage terminase Nu1 subunit (DNA packaging protein)